MQRNCSTQQVQHQTQDALFPTCGDSTVFQYLLEESEQAAAAANYPPHADFNVAGQVCDISTHHALSLL